jgi:hypothetical protein
MAILFTCSCGRQLQAREELAGRKVTCPSCGQSAVVPSTATEPESQTAGPSSEVITEHPGRRPEATPRDFGRDRSGMRGDDFDMAPGPSSTSGKAIAALVLGFLSLIGTFFFGIPALIFAILSFGDIKRGNGRVGGKGLAITAIVLACVGTCVEPLAIVPFAILFPAIARVRSAANNAKSKSNLRQIGISMLNCDAETGKLPPGAIYGQNGKPLLSWRVALLPYVEGQQDYLALYRKFHLDEPWDSPTNIKLLDQMPDIYRSPNDKSDTTETYYRIFLSDSTSDLKDKPVFIRDKRISLAMLPRGTPNTILVVEAAESVPWTKPDELPYPPTGSIESQLGGISKTTYNVLLADSHVATYQKGQLKDEELKAALSQNNAGILPEP